MAPSEPRDNPMTVRFTADEKRMIDTLSETDGVSAADVVRMAIRRAYAARFGEKPTRKPKK